MIIEPQSITLYWYEGPAKGRPGASVTVTRMPGEDRRDDVRFEGRFCSGSAVGRWPAGLIAGDVPRTYEISYIRKTFDFSLSVTSKEAMVFNPLYLRALKALGLDAGQGAACGNEG